MKSEYKSVLTDQKCEKGEANWFWNGFDHFVTLYLLANPNSRFYRPLTLCRDILRIRLKTDEFVD